MVMMDLTCSRTVSSSLGSSCSIWLMTAWLEAWTALATKALATRRRLSVLVTSCSYTLSPYIAASCGPRRPLLPNQWPTWSKKSPPEPRPLDSTKVNMQMIVRAAKNTLRCLRNEWKGLKAIGVPQVGATAACGEGRRTLTRLTPVYYLVESGRSQNSDCSDRNGSHNCKGKHNRNREYV